MNHELQGIIPPMTTPFTANGDLDLAALRAQVRFMIDAGVHGVAAGGSTGEGHTLETDELREVVAAVIDESAGRLPVVAGVIVDSTRQAVEKAQALAGLDVAALQVTPVHYLFKPDDDSTVAHFHTLCEASRAPVLIYNVVPWNYLSPGLLARVMREVPGVIGVKQSNSDLKLMADLLLAVPDGKLVLSAIDALLYPSFALGAHGTIAALPAAAPASVVALWNAVQEGQHARARDLHERLLGLWNAMVGDNLPACVKAVQEMQGCPAGYPRAPMPRASAAQVDAARSALGRLGLVSSAVA